MQALGLVRNALSILVFAWTLLTLPLALTAVISDLTNLHGALFDPLGAWRSATERLLGFWPLVGLPLWAVSLVYLAIMGAGIAWAYWSNVAAKGRLLERAVEHGDVEAEYPATFAEIVAGTAAGAGLFWAMPILKAAGWGVTLGPFGVAVAVVVVSLGILFGLSNSANKQKEKRRERDLQVAATNMAYFMDQETRRLKWATGLAVLFVIANFGFALLRV